MSNIDRTPRAANTVEEAIATTAAQVLQAYCQDTFSVGGLLMGRDGVVYKEMHNNVVLNNKLNDPTAHGERQLIDWYYENRTALSLPPARDLIIVTSLDPCAMCTGSILQAGFGLTVVSALDAFAGINFNNSTNYPTVAGTTMWPILRDTFAYPRVVGESCFARPATGATIPAGLFNNQHTITEATHALTSTAFLATLSAVSGSINADLEPAQLVNPQTLPTTSVIYKKIKAVYPQALNYIAPAPGEPDVGLAEYLLAAIAQDRTNGGDGNAVAYLDYFGNLILCTPGNHNASEIQTPFILATRTYARLRYELREEVGDEILRYLSHPKYGTFIYAKSIKIDPRGLADLGAFGSTMEGPIPNSRQFQYVVARTPQSRLDSFCEGMPPFYSDPNSVNISVSQVKDQGLINAIEAS